MIHCKCSTGFVSARRGEAGWPNPEQLLPREEEHLCVRIYTATGTAKTAVQRDDALLTPGEVQRHWPEETVSIKQELETWVQYGCISRKMRTLARNIIDAIWS